MPLNTGPAVTIWLCRLFNCCNKNWKFAMTGMVWAS